MPEGSTTDGRCACCGAPIIRAGRREEGPGWVMEQGDSRDLLRMMPAGSVDAIVTDPPYGSGGFTAAERMRSAKEKYVNRGASCQSTLPDIDGDALHPEEWVRRMQEWLAECRRVLTPDGSVFAAFIDWRNGPTLLRLVMGAGIKVRGMAVWDKGLSSRPYRGGFRNQAEYVIWGGLGRLPRQDVFLPGVLRHTSKTNGKRHITEKPVALMREIVAIARPGGLILDPFAGSSSTGVAALAEGYRYHGMESVPGYFDISVERLREAAGATSEETDHA